MLKLSTIKKGEKYMGALKSFWEFLVYFGFWLWHTDEDTYIER